MHSGWCGPEVFSEIIYRPPQHRWKLQRALELQRNSLYRTCTIEHVKDSANFQGDSLIV